MPSKRKPVKDEPDDLYQVIRRRLGKSAKGRRVIARFEKDPDSNNEILLNYLREELPKDEELVEEIAQAHGKASKAHIHNIITGGTIDQIINIAQLDKLTIKKSYSPFRDVKQLLIALFTLLIAAGSLYGIYWLSTQPQKMTGDFNIAVAQFWEITNEGAKSTALSMAINESLEKYLSATFTPLGFGLDIQVSNRNMPLITDAEEAERLARRIDADIVIYGNVYRFGNDAKFSPSFYITNLFDTDELTGETKLEKPIIISINTIDDQVKVEDELKARSTVLINFTKSLIYLSNKDLDQAIESANAAIAASETLSGDFAGRENLFLLAAQIELARNEYDNAANFLNQVIEINPNYARAYLGRGNLYYGLSILSKPYDEVLLDQCIVEYTKALEASDKPPSANIPAKAHRSLGNTYFLKAQNNNGDPDLYKTAIEHYQFVIDTYLSTQDPSLQEMAALTYFSMGIAYERIGDLPNALVSYEQSKNTSTNPSDSERAEKQIIIIKQIMEGD